ncbi:endo-1,4-beta-xylanase [Luteimonas chenhongjianii]|uniref:Beta-xylanase n=1 Tax=Luteimonas chenhongjianii TaxID=2006110 RepID=A0A290XG30_9GAMM|nr:endo-1,4-beta-xylanase [Luteimonas chenhongjianii]ATD68112.1 endo-1,4-beta-xylanase [Luteimonas chenhongjianii]
MHTRLRLLATALLLAAGLETSLLAAPPAAHSPVQPGKAAPSLKQVYADAFALGTAVNDDIVAGRDPRAQALVVQHFNALTAENVMKAEVLHPEADRWDFDAADAFVAFGRQHDMFLIGHTLVWHNQTPAWFFEAAAGTQADTATMRQRMRDYIHNVAGRYAGKVQAWDVVNEVMGEDGQYRDTVWTRAYGGDGDALVRDAFRFAGEAAPDAELYYNDFNAWRPEKRDGIVRMVKMLQDAGIRIDGIGIQGHWGLNYPSTAHIEAAIDAYAALGVKVMITELDVDVLPLTKEGQIIGQGMTHPQFQLPEFKTFLDPYRDGLPGPVEQQLADRYAELFRIFHARRDKLHRVSVWGVEDGMSWKNDYPIPGRTNYPLLFDRQGQPKPAFSAVVAVPAGP